METVTLMTTKEAQHVKQPGVNARWVLSKSRLLLSFTWLSDKTQAHRIKVISPKTEIEFVKAITKQ